MKTTNKKQKVVKGKEKYYLGNGLYDFSAELDDEFGKTGTEKRQKNLERVLNEHYTEMLSEARREAGYSQKEVAEKLGVDTAYISRIESGKITPSIVMFYRYIQVLGKDIFVV